MAYPVNGRGGAGVIPAVTGLEPGSTLERSPVDQRADIIQIYSYVRYKTLNTLQ